MKNNLQIPLKEKFKKLKLIIFDLDGTLFRLNVYWEEIRKSLLEKYENTFKSPLKVKRFYQIFESIEKNYGKDAVRPFFDLLKRKEFESVKKYGAEKLWLFTDGLNILDEIFNNNLIYTIVSNNYHQTIELVLNRFECFDKFKEIIGRDDVIFAKPNPEGLNRVLTDFKIYEKNKALFVGDNITDEEAANRAGIPFIYVEELEALLKNYRNS